MMTPKTIKSRSINSRKNFTSGTGWHVPAEAKADLEEYVSLGTPERRAKQFVKEVNKSSDVTAERFGSAVYVSHDNYTGRRSVGPIVNALNTTYTPDRRVRKQQRAVYIFTEK